MGEFLSLSGVSGAGMNQVEQALHTFFKAEGMNLSQANELDGDPYEFLILADSGNGKVSVQYPDDVMDFETPSIVLSQALKTPVFGFHIHDGDFWMYLLFAAGEDVDRFSPVPDYFVDDASDDEVAAFKGDAAAICRHWPGVDESIIAPYLVTWEEAENDKAHPDDLFGYGADHQLEDFMRRLGLPFPGNNAAGVERKFFKLD